VSRKKFLGVTALKPVYSNYLYLHYGFRNLFLTLSKSTINCLLIGFSSSFKFVFVIQYTVVWTRSEMMSHRKMHILGPCAHFSILCKEHNLILCWLVFLYTKLAPVAALCHCFCEFMALMVRV